MRKDHFALGVEAANKADLTSAKQYLLRASKEEPTNAAVWIWLGSVSHDLVEARRYFERALDAEADNDTAQKWIHHIDALQNKDPRQRSTTTVEPVSTKPCPICENNGLVGTRRTCELCGGLSSLADPSFFLNSNRPAAGMTLQAATERLEITPRPHDPDYFLALGLAYLNQNRLSEALFQLRLALRNRCSKPYLASFVAALAEYLQQPTQPVDLPAGVQTEPGPATPSSGEDTRPDLKTKQIGPESLKALEQELVEPGRGTVLVVDDSPTVRKLLSQKLERLGFKAMTAASGLEALSCLQESAPCLIILDITMPNLDGFQVCKVIQQTESMAGIPIILLSARDGFLDKVRGRMAGAVEYLTKPIDQELLRQAVERHVPILRD